MTKTSKSFCNCNHNSCTKLINKNLRIYEVLTWNLRPFRGRLVVFKHPGDPIDKSTLARTPRPNQEKRCTVRDLVVAGRGATHFFNPVSRLMPKRYQSQEIEKGKIPKQGATKKEIGLAPRRDLWFLWGSLCAPGDCCKTPKVHCKSCIAAGCHRPPLQRRRRR